MNEEIEKLEESADAYRRAHERMLRTRDEFVRVRVKAARDKAEAEAKIEFDSAIEDAHQRSVQARLALEEARIERAEAFTDAPYPRGTKFVKWCLSSYPRRWYPDKDTAGVLEPVNHDTVHPDGRNRLAEPGDYIIRVLKKDGTVSKRYERIHRGHDNEYHLPWHWYPEGVDPNAEEAAAVARNKK